VSEHAKKFVRKFSGQKNREKGKGELEREKGKEIRCPCVNSKLILRCL
jgi:hypothetical protein